MLFEKSVGTLGAYLGYHNCADDIADMTNKNPVFIVECNKKFEALVKEWKKTGKMPEEKVAPAEPDPDPVVKTLPADEEFELDIPDEPEEEKVETCLTLLDAEAKEEARELEPEPDPMTYHEMQFTTNYISSEINMEELYTIAAFFKKCKRVKVSISISEV